MFKYFTKPDGKQIAINPLHVMSITEYQMGKSYPKTVILSMTNGEKNVITEDYDFAVEHLSI